ncbi:MAG TPA: GH3 auxin-responsive promoter family protein [Anaerolineaceae bacterium]|nr:GH3 auxin-responsive promoter family protein [Anaerolineaceae bacterium]
MTKAAELLRYGRKSEVWSKYCGFLDLEMDEFMRIQERLLAEQIKLIAQSPLGAQLFHHEHPQTVEEFRQIAPVTTYEDYEPYFAGQRDDMLPQKAYLWAHTSGRSGRLKWIPYTRYAYQRLGERVLAGVILSMAREKGEVRLEEGDILVTNTPPRPFISGVTLQALAEEFNFRFIPGLDETESLSFQERIQKGFDTGLITGIDVLGSLSVVLVKMGERFAEGARTTKLSRNMFHPWALARMARGLLRSKLAGRKMLPKDLWQIKGMPCGGMDTSLYREQIAHYWGVNPYEQYGATEEGAIATQAWNKKGMTFFPDASFLEFIPEAEWAKWRQNPAYVPKTVLFNEVVSGERYEVVVTNFFAKPLVRYRMHDLIRFVGLEDQETGIKLPQMVFAGRSSDFIDLAGFTGLIDEKLVWQAILNSGVRFEDWTIRKEVSQGHPFLHLYLEPLESLDCARLQNRIDLELKKLNSFYADYATLIEVQPLLVTLLSPGTFGAYGKEMQARGADLAHLKPAHMNISDDTLAILMRPSQNQP